MDPASLMALLGKGAPVVGGAVDQGWNIYKDLEQLKLARAAQRESSTQNRFGRLLNLLNSGQGMQDRLGGQGRLFALRNPGV